MSMFFIPYAIPLRNFLDTLWHTLFNRFDESLLVVMARFRKALEYPFNTLSIGYGIPLNMIWRAIK